LLKKKRSCSHLTYASNNGEERVQKVSDYLKEGQEVKVKVLEVDRQGRVRLSMKEAAEKKEEAPAAE